MPPAVAAELEQTGLTFEVQGTAAGLAEDGLFEDLVPEVAAEMSWGALVSREKVEDEIDMMLRAIRGFWDMEPDQVMRMLAAMSARCTEMAVHLHRLEGKREWRQVRTQQVERLIAECDRQFKLASRTVEIRRQDMFMEGGRA
jgi:cytosine/adenosine deaminase-related metal-dependent hydrolase